MLSVLDFPDDILYIILRLLDIKSIYNLYSTCNAMKNRFVHGLIKVCNLSFSPLATAKFLQLDIIQDISEHLCELNMCGASDLTKSKLLPGIRRMKNLKTLDVSCTKITMSDLVDIYKVCPTISNISINFEFENLEIKLSQEAMYEYHEIFKNFISVHFVLKCLSSDLPLHMLRKSSLNKLKFTVAQVPLVGCNMVKECESKEMDIFIPFKQFCIFAKNLRSANIFSVSWPWLLPLINLQNIEIIIIEHNTICSIYTSPMFTNFFSENFNIIPQAWLDIHNSYNGNVFILMWNKDTTIFDERLFHDLKKMMKGILICDVKSPDRCAQHFEKFHISVPAHRQFHATDRVYMADEENNFWPRYFSRKRPRIEQIDLNFDEVLSEHPNIKLSVWISLPCTVTLSASSQYLKTLVYLSLDGTRGPNANDFFDILFSYCEQLVSLNMNITGSSNSVLKAIPLSHSLKNIRIVDDSIDFKMLFTSVSLCKTIENICVTDCSFHYNELADPVVLHKCINLYNLYIGAKMTNSIEEKFNALVDTLITKYGTIHHINITLHNLSYKEVCPTTFHPYLDIFNFNPLRILH